MRIDDGRIYRDGGSPIESNENEAGRTGLVNEHKRRKVHQSVEEDRRSE